MKVFLVKRLREINDTRKLKKIRKKERWKHMNKVKKFTRITGLVLKTIAIVCVVGVTCEIIVYAIARPYVNEAKQGAFDKLNDITENTFSLMENTEVYDNEDNCIASINVSNYKYEQIGNVSDYITNGYIAVEDKRFLNHTGIDYMSLGRAVVSLIKNHGQITQGGSTITQQVCKNIFLSQEQSFKRKLIEFYMAPELEKKYNKNDIMEFYVNSNFYAYNCYGVESAAEYYYGKTAKTLDLAEAATLIGVSNNPSKYNPIDNPNDSKEKRKAVLSKMLEAGIITQDEFDSSCNEDIELVLKRDQREKETYTTSYAIRCTALEMMKRDNFEFKYTFGSEDEYNEYNKKYIDELNKQESRVRCGGFKIYTSFDLNKQQILQDAVDNVLSKNKEKDKDSGKYTFQGGAVSIDNNTGLVDAIVGGRGTDDEYNRGFQAVRQPGSAIKPILDYGPAFQTGRYAPSTKVKDEEIKKGPHNSYGGYLGSIDLREALARSTNTIAYKLLQDISPKVGLEYLGKMKFDTLSNKDNVGAISLGGFTYGVRVEDMAKAYYTIENNGVYNDSTCLRSVEFQNNGVVYDGTPEKTEVYNADVAYMLKSSLQGVVERPDGTGHVGAINGIVSACKTGTTDDKKDGWFCGFTPYFTCAVWVGYDTPKSTSDLAGSTYPGAIWKDYMSEIHKGLDGINEFEKPDTIKECNIDENGNRTDNNTGITDIFSGIIDKELAKSQEDRDKEIWSAREETEAKEQESIVSRAKSAVGVYEGLQCKRTSDLDAIDNKYYECLELVNSIKDYDLKQELNQKLAIKKAKLDIEREPYDTQVKLEKQRKNEEDAKNKENDAVIQSIALGLAKDTIKSKINSLINELNAVSYPTLTDFEKLGKLSNYIEAVKETSDYTTYKSKYEKLKERIGSYYTKKSYSSSSSNSSSETGKNNYYNENNNVEESNNSKNNNTSSSKPINDTGTENIDESNNKKEDNNSISSTDTVDKSENNETITNNENENTSESKNTDKSSDSTKN